MSAVHPEWADDDQLLELLRGALGEERDVPPSVVQAGKALFTWHSVDAELAALTYDSSAVAASTRSQQAPVREMTFATRDLVIQVEATATSLRGQVVPPQRGRMELHVEGRLPTVVEIDEDGWFSVDRTAPAPFRLICRTADGSRTMTGWVTA